MKWILEKLIAWGKRNHPKPVVVIPVITIPVCVGTLTRSWKFEDTAHAKHDAGGGVGSLSVSRHERGVEAAPIRGSDVDQRGMYGG